MCYHTSLHICLVTRGTAFSEDKSGCAAMSGVLSKKNPHGIWQKRYFYLNNEYIVYKADSKATDMKGAIDVAELVSILPKGNVLTLKTTGDRDFVLQASSNDMCSAWCSAIDERKAWTVSSKASQVVTSSDDSSVEKANTELQSVDDIFTRDSVMPSSRSSIISPGNKDDDASSPKIVKFNPGGYGVSPPKDSFEDAVKPNQKVLKQNSKPRIKFSDVIY